MARLLGMDVSYFRCVSSDADVMVRAMRTSRGSFITTTTLESVGSLSDKEDLSNRISSISNLQADPKTFGLHTCWPGPTPLHRWMCISAHLPPSFPSLPEMPQ